jgi:hypothetical protein
MIGYAEYEAALQSGRQQYDAYATQASNRLRKHPLFKLRADGIWPME